MDPNAKKLHHFGCQAESKASLKCIEKNYKDPKRQTICREFFEEYKACKQEALDAVKHGSLWRLHNTAGLDQPVGTDVKPTVVNL